MKKLKFISLSLVFLCFKCELRLEDNTRILVEGTVLDQNNVPIPDAEINITTRSGGSFFGGGESLYVIGEGLSKSDGSFSVVSFYDKDEDFAIEINAGNAYSEYIYKTSTLDYTPLDLTFNLQSIYLKKRANFNLNVERISGVDNSVNLNIKYIVPRCLEVYDELILNENQSYCFEEETFNRTLNNENPNYTNSWHVLLGDVIEFTYSLNEEEAITEVITINQQDYDFTFNY